METFTLFFMLTLLLLTVCGLYARSLLKVRQQGAALAELRKHDGEYCKFLENTASKIVRYDHNCRRVYVSQSSDPSLNRCTAALLGKTPAEYPGGESGRLYEQTIRTVFSTKANASFDMYSDNETGEHHVIRFDLLPELDSRGDVVSVLGVGQDITEVIASKAYIARVTSFDQLTNLPNRIFIYDRIQQLISRQNLQPDQAVEMPFFALIYLDLDAFRELNDLLGYACGDELLCQVATRLQAILPAAAASTDMPTLARLGGDEFAILLPASTMTQRLSAQRSQDKTSHDRSSQDKSSHVLSSIEHRRQFLNQFAEKTIHTLTQPFMVDGKEVYVTACLGIVMYPEQSEDPDQLLIFADAAKCHAKKLGRNNFQFYQAEFTKQSIARTELDAALRKAIQNGELELYYQPQVTQDSRQIVGAEALLRWKHPTLGMIPPDRFIPLAEETGLIIDIGNWVLLTAFRAAVAWNQPEMLDADHATSAPPLFKIAINLSARQFVRNDLVATVRQLLKETHCMPQWIELEITESLLLDENDDVLHMLMELSDLGVALSIDDFGTGYSALSYLTRFPVSQIKIDRSFICDIPIDLEKCELVKVLIQIAKVLHLDLVAEGIETIEQVEYLARHGCNVAQGYFYYRPMPYEAFDLKVQEYKSVSREGVIAGTPTLNAVFN